jgi:predicted NAD/FAD-dependent oxidoreductase
VTTSVAVIGAGLSGLVAARSLTRTGRDVTVFDKGRRPGGRANTREHDGYRFDHGAQFFTVRDPRVEPYLARWAEAGVVAEWKGRLLRITPEGREPASPGRRYVAVPGMVDLARHLSRGLDVRIGARVGSVERVDGAWRLRDDAGTLLADVQEVVVAVPAPQAVPLLAEVPRLQQTAASVEMAPCWATLAAFDRPLGIPFDGAFITGAPLSWVAKNSSKPVRTGPESWVLHATPEWTRVHWDRPREDIPALMLKEFEAVLGRQLPRPGFQRGHRWAYALAGRPVPAEPLVDVEARIAVCGDWTVGGRVEGALLSGMAAADEL